MLQLIRDKNSISGRLIKFISTLVSLIIVFSALVYSLREYYHLTQSVKNEINVVVKLIEFQYTKLDYKDSANDETKYRSIQNLMDGLKIQNNINAALLTNLAGEPVADYSVDYRSINIFDPNTYNDKIPIYDGGEEVGYFYVSGNFSQMDTFLIDALYNVSWILLISIILSVCMGYIYARSLCSPLLTLCNNMHRIITRDDYNLKSEINNAPDEIYDLNNIFNIMLFKINKKDREIHAQNAYLESDIQKKDLELQESYEKLQFAAYHDELTLLPNIRLFKSVLEYRLKQAQLNNTKFAVLFIDLDNFKQVNDSYGHNVGDELLKKIAQLFINTLRKVDFVSKSDMYQNILPISRLGGDEFTIILNEINDLSEVDDIALRLKKSIKNIKKINEHNVHITVSIGIAIYPEHGEDATVLLKHADAAMYHAKSIGKNKYQYYTDEIGVKISNKLKIESQLADAIINDEFLVAYQPKFDLAQNNLVGLEALIRWNHPQNGIVGPDGFINISEDSELICTISDIVVEKICEDIIKWKASGIDFKKVAINVSMRQFEKVDFVEKFLNNIASHQIDYTAFELELTESMLVSDFVTAIDKLNKLKSKGVSIAIDDFGTGYSSFKYLSTLPVDDIKIDKSFISTIDTNNHNYLVVKSIINLAHSFNMKVVAEGVEKRTHIEILCTLKCDIGQGYYYSTPLMSKELVDFIIQAKNAEQPRQSNIS